MRLAVAITAVEHKGHHLPTQGIYIRGFTCDSLKIKRRKGFLTKGKEEE